MTCESDGECADTGRGEYIMAVQYWLKRRAAENTDNVTYPTEYAEVGEFQLLLGLTVHAIAGGASIQVDFEESDDLDTWSTIGGSLSLALIGQTSTSVTVPHRRFLRASVMTTGFCSYSVVITGFED
ncbi:MAG: hypothetical protein H6806_06040 [Planctomycetes bacterium]|nr:hypothetical protein [Planctomycetota bacterium]MCB9824806.1 hypothetical protein [Planctomycetota bacterium]MCB9829302.1 hypothetical protein [Planctomycetota bacterium]MCB9902442.1 hypothetical protein [Planctomycetota bacterium]